MLLAVDVGNSQTVAGLFSGEELLHDWVEERRLTPLLVRAGAKKGIVVKIGEREVLGRDDDAVAIASVRTFSVGSD